LTVRLHAQDASGSVDEGAFGFARRAVWHLMSRASLMALWRPARRSAGVTVSMAAWSVCGCRARPWWRRHDRLFERGLVGRIVVCLAQRRRGAERAGRPVVGETAWGVPTPALEVSALGLCAPNSTPRSATDAPPSDQRPPVQSSRRSSLREGLGRSNRRLSRAEAQRRREGWGVADVCGDAGLGWASRGEGAGLGCPDARA
jgi:hypothetical protein